MSRVRLRDVQLEAAAEAVHDAYVAARLGVALIVAAVTTDLRVAVEHLIAAWRCGDATTDDRGGDVWMSRGGDA